MSRIALSLLLALTLQALPNGSPAQSAGLANLQSVTVVIDDLDSGTRELGLSEEILANHTLGLLRSKAPQLTANQPSAEGSLLVDATLGTIKEEGKTVRYYGVIEIEVFRLVTVQKSGRPIWAPVWDGQYILSGEPPNAVDQVKNTLNLLLSDFATEWLEENP